MAGLTSSFLDGLTAATESNNRDYGANGQPVTSSAGARFAMQVMPSTARDPGFGLKPADPNNPEDMNRLGREYRAVMEQRYGGDYGKMWAAYNAGPGRVDAAIAKHGYNWLSAMPQETQNYVRTNMSRAGAPQTYGTSAPGQGVADPSKFLAGLESALGPEAKASSAVTQNSSATFGSDAELKKRAGAIETNLIEQGQKIDVLDQVMQAAHAQQTEAMTQQIAQTKDISNAIVQGTEELKQKVMPVFQARGRVADQLDKLATMNPLERGIRGIFDLNYDRNYLEGQLDAFDRTLKARSDDYQYLNQLHSVAMQEIDRRYNMSTALPQLAQKQAEEDLGLVGMKITQTAGMLGNLRDQITTESQLISAKAQARDDLLGRLDIPTVTDLMNQAQNTGGVVQYNGVEFSYKELRDRIQTSEQQTLQTEAYKMAIASGRMDFAEKYAVNLARSLTRPQLEAAINAGGVYQGVQLPQDVLTNLYQQSVQRDETRANVIARDMPASVALQTATSSLNVATGLYTRGKSLFGVQSMQGSETYLTQGSELVRKLITATKEGAPPEVISVLTQQIADNSAKYSAFIDDKILQRVGGDKQAADYMKGFVYGTPLSPGSAVEAMTYFAVKGNLPDGVALSPEVKQVFQKAQGLVLGHQNDKIGGSPITPQQLQQVVQRELMQTASQTMGQARYDKLYSDLPGVGKFLGEKFGQFDSTKWGEIRAQAASSAAESVARKVNTTPQNVLTMMRSGKPITNDEAGKQLLQKTLEAAPQYNAMELQMTARLLDSEPQLQTGRRNSSVMLDLLRSPKLPEGIANYNRSMGQQSIGEYLVNPLMGSSVESNFARTRDGMLDAQSSLTQSQRQIVQNPIAAQVFKPVARTTMILQSIPGVDSHGAKALQPFVKQTFDAYVKERRSSWQIPSSANETFMRQDAALLDALQAAKFEDPRLETYRKIAVKGWKEHATAQHGFVQRILDTLTEDMVQPFDSEYLM